GCTGTVGGVPGVVDGGQELGGLVVAVDQIAGIVITAGSSRNLAAEEVVEAEEAGLIAALLRERNRSARPHLAEHTPVVGGITHGLIAIRVPRADLEPADEGIVIEVIAEIRPY